MVENLLKYSTNCFHGWRIFLNTLFRCHCGRSKEGHDEDKERKLETRFDQKDGGIAGLLGGFQRLDYGSEDDQVEVEWDPSIHLKLKETNAHGDVVFNIGGKNSKAKVIESSGYRFSMFLVFSSSITAVVFLKTQCTKMKINPSRPDLRRR